MNVADILKSGAASYATKSFCIFNDKSFSYEEFVGQVHWLAEDLKSRGAQKGVRIALLAHNSPEWLSSLFAILVIGAVAVPINPGLAAPEIHTIIEHSDPTIVIAHSSLQEDVLLGVELSSALHILPLESNEQTIPLPADGMCAVWKPTISPWSIIPRVPRGVRKG